MIQKFTFALLFSGALTPILHASQILPLVGSAEYTATIYEGSNGLVRCNPPLLGAASPCSDPTSYSLNGINVNMTGAPGASITADVAYFPLDPSTHSGFGFGRLKYFFEYFGADNAILPLLIDVNATASVTGSSQSGAIAYSQVYTPIGSQDFQCRASWSQCLVNGVYVDERAAEFHGTLSGSITANTVYEIDLFAQVTVGFLYDQTAHTLADPMIYIDPTFANAGNYTLIQSPGIENNAGSTATPEPCTMVLTICGLGLAAFAKRRLRA